ncbi:MAG: amidohydrolase [Gammaproteobacteria bacterium]|nr:amidohydrolase [Gammaproteobacteria bacterium]
MKGALRVILSVGAAVLAIGSAAATGDAYAAAAPAASRSHAGASTSYAADDFARIEKIDAHMHVHGRAERLMAQAIADHFRILTIDVDYPDYPSIEEQRRDALSLRERYPGRVAYATTFSVDGFLSPGWSAAVVRDIDADVARGAVGVKIWKNIGMALRDAAGRYVMPDDPRLEPVIAHLERRHIVLLGHQAEPLNCWLPPEKMTVRSDREYFREHPQYYMYRQPEMPSHDAILAARDRMLRAHPALSFDAVHLASLEWDVDRVAEFLDRFPEARVDLAARMVHLEYQAVRDSRKVRRFLIRYQDRVIYGSDEAYGRDDDRDASTAAAIEESWRADWRFLTTSERMRSPDFDGAFTGLQLPRAVVDKIYRRNAQLLFPGAWDLSPSL